MAGLNWRFWLAPRMAMALALCWGLAMVSIWVSSAQAQSTTLPRVSVMANQTSAFEGEPVIFNLTRTGDTSSPLTVTVHSEEPRHPQFAAFVGSPVKTSHSVTFAAGVQQATLTITPDSDGAVETGGDWLEVELEEVAGSYRRGWPWQRTVTIKEPAAVTFEAAPMSITEGQSVTFTVTRGGSLEDSLVMGLTISDPGQFLRGNDWDPAPALSTEATFSAGSETATVSVQTRDDWRDIPNNSITVSPDSPGFVGSGSVEVQDNDVAAEIQLVADKPEIEEGGTVAFTLQRNDDSGNGVFAAHRL